ncbi:EAL domain-containing protein [Vibrio sp. Isolate25]|uniref:EAL domain-containing protein n=1 Tax=Vibrio sp. Isolate25 TaxID=2908535 RepID=UPI001EFC8A31|nr:EAL domain-containing protein [Vibrio sp. Isolate25]MCG9597356.1 EAL domain-containing protein [Vibrio sp. Isolate25]
MNQSVSTLTLELKSLLAYILIPLCIVFPVSQYVAYYGITDSLKTIALNFQDRIEDVITELQEKNAKAMKHPESCDAIREDLLFESSLRELIIIQDGIAICSSKRGEVYTDLNYAFKNGTAKSGAFLFDINQDPKQRTMVVVNREPNIVNSGAFAIVDNNYLLTRLTNIENDKLSFITAKFGQKVYPAEKDFTSDTLHYITTSPKYGFSLMTEASSEFIHRRVVYSALSSIPISFLISMALYIVLSRLKSRDSLVDDLKKGLKRKELFLVYQPIVDADDSQKLSGFEALIRWQHPKLGLVRPDLFIPLAEQENIIDAITDYVLEVALEDFSSEPAFRHVHLGINVPPSYLHQPQNISTLCHYAIRFRQVGIRLVVEVTERQILDDKGRDALAELRKSGVLISIDDFGTGHTALSVIQNTQFDYLKIDKCFVDTIGLETVNATVLNTIIELGHRLGVKIIAEGVEEPEQVKYLAEMKVSYLQGYYFSKPLKLETLKQSWL